MQFTGKINRLFDMYLQGDYNVPFLKFLELSESDAYFFMWLFNDPSVGVYGQEMTLIQKHEYEKLKSVFRL